MCSSKFIVSVSAVLLVVAALGSATVSASSGSPKVSVSPHPAYTERPLTILVKNVAPLSFWSAEMHNPSTSGPADEMKLGVHQAGPHGVVTYKLRALGTHDAHFNSAPYETWLVNAEPAHVSGNEPGPFGHEFRMFRGCGCGTR
jgi:hypothetical protein